MLRPLFLRRLRKYVAALPALAFGFMASPAFSLTTVNINASAITPGTSVASFLGATLSTIGATTFSTSTTPGINPTGVIGVSGGYVPTEVDVHGESLTLSFGTTGAVVNEITLGMLYLKGEAGDTYSEAAQLQTTGGSACGSGATAFCILSASGVWRGALNNGVQILSPATASGGGIFKITNPFGTETITSIDFLPWSIVGADASNSDFGLVSVTYTTAATLVPEPGTFALVSLGLLGLAVAGARRARD